MKAENTRFETAFASEADRRFGKEDHDVIATTDEQLTVYTAAKEIMAALRKAGSDRSPEQLAEIAWTSAQNISKNLSVTLQ